MQYKGFKELNSYKQARELRMYISDLVKRFPSHEKFLLSAQIIDSSRSVTSNIAEGYGRFTFNDTKHFFIIARGSTTETIEHVTTAFDEKYISTGELKDAEMKCETVLKLINGYLSYLERSHKMNVSKTRDKQIPNS
jgi:four helix bundle protein